MDRELASVEWRAKITEPEPEALQPTGAQDDFRCPDDFTEARASHGLRSREGTRTSCAFSWSDDDGLLLATIKVASRKSKPRK